MSLIFVGPRPFFDHGSAWPGWCCAHPSSFLDGGTVCPFFAKAGLCLPFVSFATVEMRGRFVHSATVEMLAPFVSLASAPFVHLATAGLCARFVSLAGKANTSARVSINRFFKLDLADVVNVGRCSGRPVSNADVGMCCVGSSTFTSRCIFSSPLLSHQISPPP